mgnify:CR=1 FL=1
MSKLRLGVNIDHVATIRQARRAAEPDPVHAAVLAELGGADGITVHLREDRRHIQDRDVRLLMETARTVVNLELAAASDVLALAEAWRPHQATLVPERREERTTEGGLDAAVSVPPHQPHQPALHLHSFRRQHARLVRPVGRLQGDGIALAAQALQRHFLLIHQGDDDGHDALSGGCGDDVPVAHGGDGDGGPVKRDDVLRPVVRLRKGITKAVAVVGEPVLPGFRGGQHGEEAAEEVGGEDEGEDGGADADDDGDAIIPRSELGKQAAAVRRKRQP